MEQRTRMFRVLVCLAVSMTAGSVMLAWLEPAPRAVAHLVTTEECVAAARVAVSSCPSTVLRRDWGGIRLAAVDGGSDRLTLAAVRSSEPVHFVVGRAGEIAADPSWREQVSTSGLREIHIGLRGAAEAETIGPAQRAAVLALLEELNQAVAPAGADAAFPVRIAREMDAAAVARTLGVEVDERQSIRS